MTRVTKLHISNVHSHVMEAQLNYNSFFPPLELLTVDYCHSAS